MSDVFSRKKRSEVMSRIRGSGNLSTELRLIKLLRANGLSGWRRKHPLPGKPDFVFPEPGLCVFVDGCFWHGCPDHSSRPKTNARYWSDKVQINYRRDRQTDDLLKGAGWTVVRIWEHEDPDTAAARIVGLVEQPWRSLQSKRN